MQQLASGLAAHIAQETTTLATCWSITRRDGMALYFTDHDRDFTVDGNVYVASYGMNATAVTSQAGMSVDNLEFDGMLSNDAIAETDILAGLYDHAEISVFMVNYLDPDAGSLLLKTGWLGEVTLRGGQFVAEMRGLTSRLQQMIGAVYTPTCRAQLGDARCGVDLSAYTVTGTVTSLEGSYAFTDSARTELGDYFANGLVTFTSGNNNGLSMEVRDYGAGRFGLFLPLPYAIAEGDTYTAIAGCDKTFESCVSTFNNAVNFRGEPNVPGTDKLLETSATRSS